MPDALDGDFSRSRAVLIGTWNYRHLPPVPAAEHSLNRMKALLRSPLCGSWPADRISVIGNRSALGDLPHELVTRFSSAADVALFYYVGHGQYDNDDRLCLSLTGSSPDAVLRTTTSLTFDAVRFAFRMSKAATKIAIVDCCFAGLAAGRDNALAGPQALELPRSPGFYLMMASGEFSTAWCETTTDTPKPQTYFTKYLADVIENGIPSQSDRLTLGSIFDTVADTLVSDGKPEPGNRASNHAAHYILARNAAPTKTQGDHNTEVAPPNAGLIENNKRKQRVVTTARTPEKAPERPASGEPTVITSGRMQTVKARGTQLADLAGMLAGIPMAILAPVLVLGSHATVGNTGVFGSIVIYFVAGYSFGYVLGWVQGIWTGLFGDLDSLTVSPGGLTVTGQTSVECKWDDLKAVKLERSGGTVTLIVTVRPERVSDTEWRMRLPAKIDKEGKAEVFVGRGIPAIDAGRVMAALSRYAGNLYSGPSSLP
jgi:hypothetical protein